MIKALFKFDDTLVMPGESPRVAVIDFPKDARGLSHMGHKPVICVISGVYENENLIELKRWMFQMQQALDRKGEFRNEIEGVKINMTTPYVKTVDAIRSGETSLNPIMQFFEYEHLPEEMRSVSKEICDIAEALHAQLPDSAEKSAGLRKLLEAKDCFVRSVLLMMRESEGQ